MKLRRSYFLFALACLTVLRLSNSAQGCEYPPYYQIWYGEDWKYTKSWDPGHEVQTFMDDRFDPVDRAQLLRGVFNWNSWRFADCTEINFVDAGDRSFAQ